MCTITPLNPLNLLGYIKMDRILPEAASKVIADLIENVYSYGPLAQKTVVLGEFCFQ